MNPNDITLSYNKDAPSFYYRRYPIFHGTIWDMIHILELDVARKSVVKCKTHTTI